MTRDHAAQHGALSCRGEINWLGTTLRLYCTYVREREGPPVTAPCATAVANVDATCYAGRREGQLIVFSLTGSAAAGDTRKYVL